jgi:hypothetical protein
LGGGRSPLLLPLSFEREGLGLDPPLLLFFEPPDTFFKKFIVD